jgi:3-hydroxyacyl-CoA dehydrogenase
MAENNMAEALATLRAQADHNTLRLVGNIIEIVVAKLRIDNDMASEREVYRNQGAILTLQTLYKSIMGGK